MTDETGEVIVAEETKPKNDYQVTGDDTVVKTEDAAKPKEEDATEVRKPKRGGFQKKISKLREEVGYWKGKAETLSTSQGQTQAPPAKVQSFPVVGRPTPDQYPNLEDYNRALVRFEWDEIKREEKQEDLRKKFQEKQQKWQKGIQAKIAENPEVADVIEKYYGPNVTQILASALLDSNEDVAIEIAKDPEKWEKANSIRNYKEMDKFIAREELRLEKESEKEAEPRAPAPKVAVTKAPPPIKPVTKSAQTSQGYSEDMSYEEYKAARRSGKI